MSRLAIRCDPQTAIATDEVEQWLQREVERFRTAAPRASFRLHRLSKTESTIATGRGWLIELDATYEEDPLDWNRLDAARATCDCSACGRRCLESSRTATLQPSLFQSARTEKPYEREHR